MNVDILCSVNDEGLARRCASVAGERVTTILVGDSEPAKPAEDEAANLTSSWDGLLERTRQRTRFNCPRRFVEGVQSAEPGQPSGIAALFSTDQPQALVVGKLDLNDTWQGVGPLSRILPGLPTLEIAHSALVTDSSSEAVEAAVGYLAKLLRSDVAKRLQVKNLLVDSALHAAETRGPVPPPAARSGNRRAGSGQFVEDPAGASTQTAKPQERARRRRGIHQGNAPRSDRRIPARRRRDRREDLPGGHRRGREGRCPYAGVPAQTGHRGYAARLSVSRQRPGHRLCSGRRGKLHIQSLGDVVPARIRAVFARYRIARPGLRGAHLGGCRVVRLRPRQGHLQAAVG